MIPNVLLGMLSGAAFLFMFGVLVVALLFADWLHDHRRPIRARTCGTCAYCEYGDAEAHGLCCRREYKTRIELSGHEPKRDSVVRLDWRGCGESEEKP